ncbi:beta-ketoacyl synthase N-terminal-like domain-containing protein [Roseimaritima ulvae]|uniref:3-oxoacyl-[acyl-carrier-protein] synthase 2 n=1 Tax=Roseimaritima ulvae TaxID=980254 RepID=A0A5B9R0V7_9BACT|nr:beta-ketoacyl synthase N-terminal-like domain-containing protein [Roseimaritima ulvae]QEG39861.1 3-oxoacyl-[acyl-carrier-protein] synthase 2 [Roseimaritima ulvae]
MPAQRSARDAIVITGIGVITPWGCTLDSLQQTIHQPRSTGPGGQADFAGHVDDFGPLSPQTKRTIRKSLKLMNRETQMGVAAAQHAITDSRLSEAGYDLERVGVCFGAGNVEIRREGFEAGVAACREALGEFDPRVWGDYGIPTVDPLWILRVLPNMPACHAAIANDLRGPNNTITQAAVATVMAFEEARHAILDGDADAMIVGGTGTGFLEANRSLADATDAADCGSEAITTPAEAAGAFVLERLDAAIKRQATVYAEVLATASTTVIDAQHRAEPYQAARAAVATAVERSGVAAPSIGLLHADPQFVDFGQATEHLKATQIRSLKPHIGDAAAGSSAIEIAASLLSVHNGPSVAINVQAMPNGLASCLVLGKVERTAA